VPHQGTLVLDQGRLRELYHLNGLLLQLKVQIIVLWLLARIFHHKKFKVFIEQAYL
jgi:hypothetical protein